VKRLQTIGLAVTVLLVAALAGSAAMGFFQPRPAAEVPPPPEAVIDGDRLRVEVLNGAGVPGLARDVTRLLRQRNFDVVFYGNAPGGARDTSVVIDRVGRIEDAQRVADALGIEVVRSAPDTTLYLEATVVLGRDWMTEPDDAPEPDPDEPATAP
jgi:hypothetical protein